MINLNQAGHISTISTTEILTRQKSKVFHRRSSMLSTIDEIGQRRYDTTMIPICRRRYFRLSRRPLWTSILFAFVLVVVALIRGHGMIYNDQQKSKTESETESEHANKMIVSRNNNNHNSSRVRFTQVWSTGHVGTRFLTGLLAAPRFFHNSKSVANSNTSSYLAWHEHELPLMALTSTSTSTSTMASSTTSATKGGGVSDLSLYEFQAMMAMTLVPNNPIGERNFHRYIFVRKGSKYGGQLIKGWNIEGRRNKLRQYLQEKRMTVLRSVFQRYNNSNSNKLNHFIKVGHTSVFFDLSDYYEVLSSTTIQKHGNIDVDFVRVERNRIDVANSFIGDKGRMGPSYYKNKIDGIVTSPDMKTSLLRLHSIGGILPDEIWRQWSIFQQHLWFADEIEARWQVFLKDHPEVSYYVLSYDSKTKQLNPESIDDMAVNFLNIDPISQYMDKISHQSHLPNKNSKKKNSNLSKAEMERQAIEYSKQAPWCIQYNQGNKQNIKNNDSYPLIDCGVLA